VPNADEMADWISSVRGGDVVVILEKKRRVPLSTQWILPDGKIVDEKEAQQEIDELIEYNKALRHKKRWSGE
jgi:superfamily II RNA helicase